MVTRLTVLSQWSLVTRLTVLVSVVFGNMAHSAGVSGLGNKAHSAGVSGVW